MGFKTLLTCAIALASLYCSAPSDGDDYCFFNNVEQVEVGSHLELRNLGKLEQLVRAPSPKLQGFIEEAKREHDASLKEFLAKYDDLHEASSNQSVENVSVVSSENDNRFSHMECVYADKVSKLSVEQKKMLLLYLQCVKNGVISEMDDASQWPAISGEKLWKYLPAGGEEAEYNYILIKRLCSDYINTRLFTERGFNYEYVAQKILHLVSYSEADSDKIFASLIINFFLDFPTLPDVVNACVENMRSAYSRAITYGWRLHKMSIPKDLFIAKALDIYGKENFINNESSFKDIDILECVTALITYPDTCPDSLASISAFDFDELKSVLASFKAGLSQEEIKEALKCVNELAQDLFQINSAGAEMQHAYPNFASNVAEELSDHNAFEHLLIAQDSAYQDWPEDAENLSENSASEDFGIAGLFDHAPEE